MGCCMPITQQLLHDLFEYKDGELYWKVKSLNNKFKPGDLIENKKLFGRRQIKINGKQYLIHRIIYMIHYGFMPNQIDHIDGNPNNNKIENLREATALQNAQNAKLRKDNCSGIKGVAWVKRDQKWRVQLSINGKIKSFGNYFDLKVAKFVAETMRNHYHKEFTNHG